MNVLDRTISFMNKYGVGAQKRFSQNFLINERAIKTIVDTIPFNKVDEVIEIGPGLGGLTFEILKHEKKLVAIEFDNDMVKVLKDEINNSNFTLIQNDFLKEDLSKFPTNISYIGNLPYQITRDLIKKVLTQGKFVTFGFMVQKDVADEMFYKQGSSLNNTYSAFLAINGTLTRVLDLKPNCFYPSPKVDSTFLNLEVTDYKYCSLQAFNAIDALFKNIKKSIYNNLKVSKYKDKIDVLEKLNISRDLRSHQLSIEQIKDIIDFFTN